MDLGIVHAPRPDCCERMWHHQPCCTRHILPCRPLHGCSWWYRPHRSTRHHYQGRPRRNYHYRKNLNQNNQHRRHNRLRPLGMGSLRCSKSRFRRTSQGGQHRTLVCICRKQTSRPSISTKVSLAEQNALAFFCIPVPILPPRPGCARVVLNALLGTVGFGRGFEPRAHEVTPYMVSTWA